MDESDQHIDWSKTTFEGSRREQLRRWCALTLIQRLEALDEMSDLAQHMAESRRKSRSKESSTAIDLPAMQSDETGDNTQ